MSAIKQFVHPLSGGMAFVLSVVVSLLVAVPASASFGLQTFESSILNQNGLPDIQAGSHPATFTTTIKFKTVPGFDNEAIPDEDVKDLEVELPAGLVGNANAIPRCTIEQFTKRNPHRFLTYGLCPNDSQVGIAQIEITPTDEGEPVPAVLGIYNLVPPSGVPAEFGLNPTGIPVVIIPKVRTGKDYGVTAVSKNTPQAQRIFGLKTVFWGVPAAASHDGERGECLGELGETFAQGEEFPCPVEGAPRPFLTLPTSCPAGSLSAAVHADSWQNPVSDVELEGVSEVAFNRDGEGNPVGVGGCEDLDFSPSMSIRPDTEAAGAPAGASAEVSLPQNENPNGLAEANLKTAVVTLPKGVTVSPSAANGLSTCGEEQIALHSDAPVTCPIASKVGTVEIETPLLETPLVGSVYLAQQEQNPFGGLLALYVAAEGSGVTIKLAGDVHADPVTGQLTATFNGLPAFVEGGHSYAAVEGNPQQPFGHLKLTFYGGPRAALMTPRVCGSYSVTGELTPWSSNVATALASPFQVTSNCEGGFAPSFLAGTVNNQAAGFSPLTVTLSRSDQEQGFKQLTLKTPPGLLGMISNVTLCGEPQAAEGTCPESSKIGHVTVGAGPGPEPVYVPQTGKPQDPVYLTGPYNGAPFGLSVVVPPEAGPFTLGPPVVVRSKIEVDPHTGQITIVSNPFPTILDGIPLDIKTINVDIDHQNFIFNPTNCQSLTFNGSAESEQGAVAPLINHFEAANCASLPFNHTFTASTQSTASKSQGADLGVKLEYPGGGSGQANVAFVKVQLPKQLPSRLTTLQQACTEQVFAANPASCPAASNVGMATAITPVLSQPATGPVYLVSHGGAAFPDVDVVLQDENVTVDLVGNTNIVKQVTTSTFASVPDVPISRFELDLPKGPHSALSFNLPAKDKGSFCTTALTMPTTVVAQNGAQIVQNTPIKVSGCPKIKKIKKHVKKKKHHSKPKKK
jgi:hypothetical protein